MENKYVVLVIDDEESVREAVHDILEIVNIHVYTAPDGRTGLALYQAHQSEIDLVLLDLSMPGISGEETFKNIREFDPQARILLSSGYSNTEISSRYNLQNITGFIQKPYTLQTLIEQINGYLQT